MISTKLQNANDMIFSGSQAHLDSVKQQLRALARQGDQLDHQVAFSVSIIGPAADLTALVKIVIQKQC